MTDVTDAILVLNAGSSSLKFSVFPAGEPAAPLLHGHIEGLSTGPHFIARDGRGGVLGEKRWPADSRLSHRQALDFLFDWGRGRRDRHRLIAVGHRVVHGGRHFTGPAKVTPPVLAALEDLVPLAPLHQPHNLAGIRAVADLMPGMPQVACFDTAFHRTQPAAAQAFALPRRFAAEGVLRYGFHGLSYESIAAALRTIDRRAAEGRAVVAHLGNGAGLCAVQVGRSIATTMSFTPLDGLMMGTRCGALDPGVILYLMDRHGLDARGLERLLYHESGLLGVSELSSDMRVLLASGDPRAAEAVDLFVYRIGRELGSMTAALGGLDALVFTGGIGENAAEIRARVCRAAAWAGVALDSAANEAGGPRISLPESRVAVWVIPTQEEAVIARHTAGVLGGAASCAG